ncbi:GNAT family N-acetyltransferase [Bordetella petrii]|uniref:Probable acetyltransferase n=1 Tax=Bordetella petrii (strain ATCC BAA-461 / DSM 12804 / CCUG 43448 / CIP 107267 / Se-1111R) TaxID=340100 RepID=A9IQF5_BORPD|nr:GNAT family N-acetyltransferase [Bordetella petrii]CAP43051.1 probable acetyltransferase [Bordetella petrii]
MPTPPAIRIVLGTWERLRDDAYSVRHEVFVLEQAVPPEIELDDDDPVAVHAVAYGDDGTPIATGRLLPDGHIGRMAVRKAARGSGVGGQVLDALIAQGHGDGHRLLLLHAQTHARGFYEAHGFAAQGEPFVEAGIEHIAMTRELEH